MSRSRAKRCSRSARRWVSVGSFSATSRLKAPSARRANHTCAIPPAPRGRINSYGPTRAPGCRPFAATALATAAKPSFGNVTSPLEPATASPGSSALRSAGARSWYSGDSLSIQRRRPAASSGSASSSRRLISAIWRQSHRIALLRRLRRRIDWRAFYQMPPKLLIAHLTVSALASAIATGDRRTAPSPSRVAPCVR